jgi:hypothetical protein
MRSFVSVPALLRVVAIVAFIQFLGHGSMFVRAKPTHGAEETAVVESMKTHAFRFAAAPRSYWDMYVGYGLEAAFICLIEAVLFWQLAGIASGNAAGVRPIVALFAGANVAHIALLARYFAFPLPMAFDAVIAAVLVVVLFLA